MIGISPTSDAERNGREHIEISIRAWHTHEDPDVVSQVLQRTPSYSYKAGDPRVAPNGRLLGSVHRDTLWLCSLKVDKDASLADAISAMGKMILQSEKEWNQLKLRGWRFECFLGVFLNGNRTEILSAELMRQWAIWGIDLVLNLYPSNLDTLE